jgi:hypothetical protein
MDVTPKSSYWALQSQHIGRHFMTERFCPNMALKTQMASMGSMTRYGIEWGTLLGIEPTMGIGQKMGSPHAIKTIP